MYLIKILCDQHKVEHVCKVERKWWRFICFGKDEKNLRSVAYICNQRHLSERFVQQSTETVAIKILVCFISCFALKVH